MTEANFLEAKETYETAKVEKNRIAAIVAKESAPLEQAYLSENTADWDDADLEILRIEKSLGFPAAEAAFNAAEAVFLAAARSHLETMEISQPVKAEIAEVFEDAKTHYGRRLQLIEVALKWSGK